MVDVDKKELPTPHPQNAGPSKEETHPTTHITVRKGQWFTYCCHKDLEQATEDFDEEAELIEVWDSKVSALLTIAFDWFASGSIKEGFEALIYIFKRI